MDFIEELDKDLSDFLQNSKIQLKDDVTKQRYYEAMKSEKDFFESSDFFSEMCAVYQHTISISEKYRNNCKKIFRNIENDTVRVQRCVLGNLTRGFYYPCPVEDIITSGVNRGKIIKRPHKSSVISHIFGFDKQNRLTTVKMLYCGTYYSFLIYNSNTVTEYIFEDSENSGVTLTGVTEATYDEQGRIISLIENLDLADTSCFCTKVVKKTYFYNSTELKSLVRKELTICKNSPDIPNYAEYDFDYNEEGCLTSYRITRPNDTKDKPHIFSVLKGKQRKF